jgi:hypothetical protein
VVSFVSNVRRAAEGLFLQVFDIYGNNKVVRTAGRQAGQLAGQLTSGLQEAGGRASAAMSDLRGKDGRVHARYSDARVTDTRAKNGRVKNAGVKDVAQR